MNKVIKFADAFRMEKTAMVFASPRDAYGPNRSWVKTQVGFEAGLERFLIVEFNNVILGIQVNLTRPRGGRTTIVSIENPAYVLATQNGPPAEAQKDYAQHGLRCPQN